MSTQLLDVVRQKFGHGNDWALVIGDVMLDRYLIGDVQRISPEAPVPVVLLKQQNERAGGAANVAANLALLGIPTAIVGCVGKDHDGELLRRMISDTGINTDGMLASAHRPTVTKTRILGGHQQMMRLDQEDASDLSEEEAASLQVLIDAQLAKSPAIVILSDYAKGLLGKKICQTVITHCRQYSIPVLVDPKGKDYSKYAGATALTPNKKETAEAVGVSQSANQQLLAGATELRKKLGLDYLAVTRGEEGISLIASMDVLDIPATAKQVFDVSGAGDTVIATLAAGLVHKMSFADALRLANIAAGVVVGKVGTVPITLEDLTHALISEDSAAQTDKLCNLETLKIKVQAWKAKGQKIVFTNGCFDLLHAGHVTYLEAARKTGDRLVLGLNTDRSVSALKGPTRPVIHEQDRARVLAALEAVDAVVLFDEDTPLNLINSIRPDIIVKGSDYTEDGVVGGKEVKSWGGEIKLIDIVPGRSTSKIIEKLAS